MANIYIDIDDTLGDHTINFINFFEYKYNIKLDLNELKIPNYVLILNSRMKTSIDLFQEFHKHQKFEEINPFKGSIGIIKNLSNFHKLFLITGRPDYLMEQTHKWVSKFFPDCFSQVHVTNYFPRNGSKKGPEKIELCKKLNCTIAIDDDPRTALQMAEAGMKVLIFNQPWNEHIKHTNITRVFNWEEIYNILKKRGN